MFKLIVIGFVNGQLEKSFQVVQTFSTLREAMESGEKFLKGGRKCIVTILGSMHTVNKHIIFSEKNFK